MEEEFRTGLFVNITEKPFTGFWSGKKRTFKPGEKKYMPEYLARHFGKHLTNQILIEQGKETATSPKKPDEVKDFSDIFNKVCIIDEDQEETGSEADREIELANKKQPKIKTIVDNKPPQIIEVPEDDEEDEAAEDESDDEEKEFPNLKK